MSNAVVSPDGRRLYVTDALAFDFMTHVYSGGVHVVDTSTRRLLASINVGNGPCDIVLNRAGTLAYVLNCAGATISVVDLRTRSVIRTLNVPVGPTELVLNAAETTLYVATNGTTVGLVILDVKTGRITANIPAGWDAQTLSINASETNAYMINVGDGRLTVIDLRARRVKSLIDLGEFVYGVTVNPAGTRAYINGFASIMVVNLSTQQVVARIPLTATVAGRMHLSRTGTLAFAIGAHDQKSPAGGILDVIDLASNTVVGNAPVCFMGNPIAFEPSGQRAYIPCGNTLGGTVTLVQIPQ
ncbi:YncE family protein [Arthrobacter sp. NPDC057388]|uniref:YncE family protein n=1 Tax=Arthrobacter sp. NPDC057388 TaxID=3346116 RepID=UPI00363A747A